MNKHQCSVLVKICTSGSDPLIHKCCDCTVAWKMLPHVHLSSIQMYGSQNAPNPDYTVSVVRQSAVAKIGNLLFRWVWGLLLCCKRKVVLSLNIQFSQYLSVAVRVHGLSGYRKRITPLLSHRTMHITCWGLYLELLLQYGIHVTTWYTTVLTPA